VAKTRDALSVQQGQTRKGLQVRRLFTTDEAHPYDELTWERRDAVITNWRDGSIAFEQRDLEFPTTWSQNATNIVAQKYFRGPLGTPQREHSVRQMIDRVAGTITNWGVKDGYFAGQADAEAFRSELTHLLANQRAAFNSPVWFNVGVEPHPQCSACFILSVEDTMPSILNWYVEEGLIFKGGSGSGINLSTIRSSKEPLGNGGEASGPVSFMRGADASAGTIKCLHRDTEIVTDQGVTRIADVKPEARVLTRYGFKQVVAVHDNGVRPLVRVRTSLGDEILCTPEHRFRVLGAEGEVWREAQHLRPDDYVVIDLSNTEHGSLQRLVPVGPGHHNEIVHALPETLNEAFALWLGWIYGDGSITSRPSTKFIAMQLGDGDPDLVDRYAALTRTVFGTNVHIFTNRHTDKADASASVRFCSSQAIRFLEANGLRKGKTSELRVPELVKSSPPAVRAAFLSGVFEADGHIGNGYPTLSTISASFAQDVHRLLLSIGIPSQIGVINDRATARGRNPVHTVRVAGGEGVRRFAKLVGFVSERKSRALEAAVTRKGHSPYETAWVLPHAAAALDAVWRTAGPSLKRALAPYARYSARRSMSLLRARVLLDAYPQLNASSLTRFALGQEFYVSVTVEPAGEGPTLDLTVADVHEYLVHNIVTHNSGGKTRRAAKMVILNVDHPDVRDFIWCKAREEHKARVLRDNGFDMDLDGRDSISIQYQNANNSVRVTDEFVRAYESDGEFDLKAVLDGHTVERARARELMREIAQAAWECADPGMQYDTIINDWHTTPESGRINASNPCFTGETLVHTDKGLIRFDELARRAVAGETFGIYTHDATSPDAPSETVTLSRHDAVMVTGTNPIVRLTFSNGSQIRCTPNHRFWTANRGWVAAEDLASTDEIRLLDQETPATAADHRLPVPTDVASYTGKGDHSAPMTLPEKWDPEFAHLLGWLLGDGSFSGNVISAIYGSAEDQEAILPRHQELFSELNGGREPGISVQKNGTVQLRLSRRALASFFEALGLKRVKAAEKDVPWSILQAPTDIVGAFLRGLFDADGTVVNQTVKATRYVGLGSRSIDLLRSVQVLLSSLGITSCIYANAKGGASGFAYTGRDGAQRFYESGVGYDLRIAGENIDRFAALIGFQLPSKVAHLEAVASAAKYRKARVSKLVRREDDGFALTYNLSEPKNHSYIVQGAIVSNCSEYMHLDNSACNLASLNLLKFLGADGVFDVEAFKHAVEVMFLAQEIIVGNSSYPTDKITKNAKDYRQLGLGYANLGALLMAQGLPYDSDGGRAWAAAITALMTGHAYRTSARVAQVLGPFAGYAKNRTPMLRVMGKHRKAVDDIDASAVQPSLLDAARTAWDETLQFGAEHGFRNAQASVIAPTGTIGLLMDCDTTGIEPDLALVKTKKLVGGGSMSIVNQTVPRALRQLGYADEHVQAILEHIAEHNSVKGAPALREEHYPVFDCAMGDSPIHYMGHIRMMAAVQPFISGAISKTVNMPESVSVEEVERAYHEGWKLGLKALAIYRDNCKVGQPLSATKSSGDVAAGGTTESKGDRRVVADTGAVLEVNDAPVRRRLPRTRPSKTTSFRVGDIEGYLTAGSYPDDGLGEIFVKVSKQGSTLSGVMDAFAIAVSMGLQYGVPLEVYVAKFSNMIFEPNGITDDPDIRITQSLVDYIARRLAIDYLDVESRQALGVKTTAERIEEVNGNGSPGAASSPAQASTGAAAPADASAPASAAGQATEGQPVDQAESRSTAEVEDAPTVAPASPHGELAFTPGMAAVDAPFCSTCGVRMRPAGSCFVCESCGTTSGCS
jgi:ribonucleoside-diphosphate reductase alpha chain